MEAYLINPWDKTVTKRYRDEWNGDEIRTVLLIDYFTVHQVTASGDVMYLDDEGLLKPNIPVFFVQGIKQPFAGRALWIGTTYSGDNDDPASAFETVMSIVRFTEQQTTGDLGPPESTENEDGFVYKMGDPILK